LKWQEEITPADIEKFTAVHGRTKASRTLALLNRGSKFSIAIASELGQEFLKELMVKSDLLLLKIIDNKATEDEKAEYRVVSDIFNRWAKKIGDYQKLRNKVKGR
jgi:hypothetical protein